MIIKDGCFPCLSASQNEGVKGEIISPFRCPFCIAPSKRKLRARAIASVVRYVSSRSNCKKNRGASWAE